ncbi:MAG: OmpA family protein [Chitinophagaceae bacterium]|nr:OmpA family protein [Chitinophagaceae bacterium]
MNTTLNGILKWQRLMQIITALLFLMPLFTFGQSTSVQTLRFASGSYKIDKKYFSALNEIGHKCSSDTFGFLKIFAYTDTKGSIKYNKRLSKKRAEVVYNYLTKHFKFDITKVYITWLGEETDGAYDLHFPDAHVQQRCVDIILSFKKPLD